MTMLNCLLIIAKRSRLICIITIVAAFVSIIYSFLLPDVYTAKVMLLPKQEEKGVMSAMMGQFAGLALLSGGGAVPTTDGLYVSILKSEVVKDPVIDRNDLMKVYGKKYRSDTYAELDRKTTVSSSKKDSIITLSVDDKSPRRAAEIANTYVEELAKVTSQVSMSGAGESRAFLEKRLGDAKADLVKSEENLKQFQLRHKAVHVPAQTEAAIRDIAEMKSRLASQEVLLATYRRQFTDSSQEVKNLMTLVHNLKSQIARLEGSGGSGAIPSLGAVPDLGQEYVRLTRDFKVNESLVEVLTKQYEMARLSESKDVSPFQVIMKARIPEKKSKPNRLAIVAVAVAAALIGSMYYAFILEYVERMNDRDKSVWSDIASHLTFWKKKSTGSVKTSGHTH